MDLSKLLKAHEGKTFYCTLIGECKIKCEGNRIHVSAINGGLNFYLTYEGKYSNSGETVLLPSASERNWEKWISNNTVKMNDPVMVSSSGKNWHLRHYYRENRCFLDGLRREDFKERDILTNDWHFIVPVKYFDFDNILFNTEKSIV